MHLGFQPGHAAGHALGDGFGQRIVAQFALHLGAADRLALGLEALKLGQLLGIRDTVRQAAHLGFEGVEAFALALVQIAIGCLGGICQAAHRGNLTRAGLAQRANGGHP